MILCLHIRILDSEFSIWPLVFGLLIFGCSSLAFAQGLAHCCWPRLAIGFGLGVHNLCSCFISSLFSRSMSGRKC